MSRTLRHTFARLIIAAALNSEATALASSREFAAPCSEIVAGLRGPGNILLQSYWEGLGFKFPLDPHRLAPSYGTRWRKIPLTEVEAKNFHNLKQVDLLPSMNLIVDEAGGVFLPIGIEAHNTVADRREFYTIDVQGDLTFLASRRAIELGSLVREFEFEYGAKVLTSEIREFKVENPYSNKPRARDQRSVFGYESVFDPNTIFSRSLLETVFAKHNFKSTKRILVMGTGSGVDLIFLRAFLVQKGLGDIKIDAVDINPMAIAATRANAAFNGVHENTEIYESDGFSSVRGPYELIVFDSPVPRHHESPYLNVHDPHGRLIRRLLGGLSDVLAPGGAFYMMNYKAIDTYVPQNLDWRRLYDFDGRFSIHRFSVPRSISERLYFFFTSTPK